jgi:hypothetical protein
MARAGEYQGVQDRLTEIALEFADAGEQALFLWNPLCSVLWRRRKSRVCVYVLTSLRDIPQKNQAFQGLLCYTSFSTGYPLEGVINPPRQQKEDE